MGNGDKCRFPHLSGGNRTAMSTPPPRPKKRRCKPERPGCLSHSGVLPVRNTAPSPVGTLVNNLRADSGPFPTETGQGLDPLDSLRGRGRYEPSHGPPVDPPSSEALAADAGRVTWLVSWRIIREGAGGDMPSGRSERVALKPTSYGPGPVSNGRSGGCRAHRACLMLADTSSKPAPKTSHHLI